jgi:integrase
LATNSPPKKAPKDQWPYVKFEAHRSLWRVDARTAKGGARRYFTKHIEAIGWAQAQRALRANEGDHVFDNTELAAFGLTVADAIRLTLENCRRAAASLPIEEVIDKLVETKRAAKRADSYLYLLGHNLDRLAKSFPDRLIATITTEELNGFLASLSVAPETWNTIRRDCVTLWNFAETLGVVSKNVASKTERAKSIDGPPGIFTPEEIAALLTHASDDLLAFYAIGAFAGLRTCELEHLDWRNVNLARNFIEVGAATTKTRSRRIVPILPNLKAWLEPVAKAAGPVCAPNLRKKQPQRAILGSAGSIIKEWPENGLRHSFISYRLAAIQDSAKVALEAGHGQAILFKHYRELVHPEDAERYFNILPAAAGNIVNIAAA